MNQEKRHGNHSNENKAGTEGGTRQSARPFARHGAEPCTKSLQRLSNEEWGCLNRHGGGPWWEALTEIVH